MQLQTLALFVATVLPLICTPGPDMLFVTAQSAAGGTAAGLKATAGICAGYGMHSALVALGLAAIVAASPILFEAMRWLGVGYLIYLATQLIRSALRPGRRTLATKIKRSVFRRGFLTSLLNPKGMMIYVAILPQFTSHAGDVALQAAILSAIFITLCGAFYSGLSIAIGSLRKRGGFSDQHRRWVEGISGGVLMVAAGRLAAN
jgi:threonine/homoserine/homoserine lactone efflux protein